MFDLLPYCLIPLIAALVGWSTNWIAIKLMFYPLEFKGYRALKLGWQGVIPRKARKMARVVVQNGLASLASVTEVYAALDRSKLIEQFHKVMLLRLDSYVQDVIQKVDPQLWKQAPTALKQQILTALEQQLPHISETIFNQLETHIETLLDLGLMVEEHLAEHKELLCQIFQEAGEQEFRFIIRSGFHFGFIFGCIQMLVWWLLPLWWILPLFGLLVGYATNVIALKMIFQPLNPVRIGPFTLQGLFLKRQKEVAQVICRITTEEVITINNILKAILQGPKSEQVRLMILQEIEQVLDHMVAQEASLSKIEPRVLLPESQYGSLTATACATALEYLNSELKANRAFSDVQAPIINQLLQEKMINLSPEAFQGILRPAFQEDEFTLILIGAVLGGMVGLLQLMTLFSETLP